MRTNGNVEILKAPTTQLEATRSGTLRGSDGNKLYYRSFGSGDPIVISNNFFMNADHWEAYIGDVANRFEVICYDLRNQGKSEFTDADVISVDQHAQDLGAIITGLALDKPILVGTCISTAFCKEYAASSPDNVAGLFLVGPVFSPFGDRQLKFLHKTVLRSLDNGGVGALFDHYYPILYSARSIQSNGTVGYLTLKQRFIANNPEDQLRLHLQTTMLRTDTAESISAITKPIHFIAGECDPLTDLSSLKILAEMSAHGTASMIKLAGHNPYLDATSEFEDALIEFAISVHGCD